MKRAFVFLILLAGIAYADATAWKELPAKDGRWTVKFPGAPTEEKVSTPTQVGTLEANIWMVALPTNVAYAASVMDYPNPIPKAQVETKLDDARDGMVGKVKGKLAAEAKITLAGGFPGREARVLIGDATLLVRTYLVNRRLYQLMVIMGNGAEPDTFFGSFKVLKP
jgi:hypothetical protein